jgi:hypothetical protein
VIATSSTFSATPDQTWKALMFFEQIRRPPPFSLRLLLPEPIRVEGDKSAVGDEARCVYRQGHLLKRVTRIEPGRYWFFEIADQRIEIVGGIRLAGGGYALRELSSGTTRVELQTRYISSLRPRWLARPIEAAVCHCFHRHILEAMRRAVETASQATGIAGGPGEKTQCGVAANAARRSNIW